MDNNILVSVVLPVFNTKAYLKKSIDSVINQTYRNIEIILVDDESTDGSSVICDNYEDIDNRIRVFHVKHQGLVAARKEGIMHSNGQYVMFVDSDDWIEESLIEVLVDRIDGEGIEVVTSGVIRDYNGSCSYYVDDLKEGLYKEDSINRIREHIIFDGGEYNHGIRPYLVAKLLLKSRLRELYENIPCEIENGEDMAVLYPICLSASGICVTHYCLYHYVQRADSMSNSYMENYLETINAWYMYEKRVIPLMKTNAVIKKQIDALFVKLIIRGINYYMDLSEDVRIPAYYFPGMIDKKSKIVLYAGGKVGEAFYLQFKRHGYEIVAWVDKRWDDSDGIKKSTKSLRDMDFDYLIIAISNRDIAEEIKQSLILDYSIEKDKIIWEKPQGFVDMITAL